MFVCVWKPQPNNGIKVGLSQVFIESTLELEPPAQLKVLSCPISMQIVHCVELHQTEFDC